MKTRLKKIQQTTIIKFNKQGPLITLITHNTDLKNWLVAYAGALPGGGKEVFLRTAVPWKK